MTEEEAKTKWCPFARTPVFATELRDIESAGTHEIARVNKLVVAANRAESHRPLTLCIGSACMAWRWGQKPNPDYRPLNQWPEPWPPKPMTLQDRESGGCGLAGTPQ